LSNLERLHVMRTRVGDTGLGYLEGLTSISTLLEAKGNSR